MNAPEQGMVTQNPSQDADKAARASAWPGRLFRLLLLAAIVAVAGGISYYWLTNRPTTQRRPPKRESVLVDVLTVQIAPHQVVIEAMGTVVPAREIEAAALVSGQIIAVDPRFEPGGRFQTGETLLTIDPVDYELAVQQQTGNLIQAQSDLKLEMGQQAVAKREYEILGETAGRDDEELLLRQPQLAAKKASVSIATALLEKAQISLQRTQITAPFNAVIKARMVDLGSYVSPGTPLATLIDTDEFWIEVSVPVDELIWIDIPGRGTDSGARVRVFNVNAWGAESYREGQVARLLADLEAEGRMARVLVAVADPLDLKSQSDPHPLLLGSFVRVAIGGRDLQNVARIPRSALHNGRNVWIMGNDNTLEVRSVELAWSAPDEVYVSNGLAQGDQLVVSDLSTPVSGMALRTSDAATGDSVPPVQQPEQSP